MTPSEMNARLHAARAAQKNVASGPEDTGGSGSVTHIKSTQKKQSQSGATPPKDASGGGTQSDPTPRETAEEKARREQDEEAAKQGKKLSAQEMNVRTVELVTGRLEVFRDEYDLFYIKNGNEAVELESETYIDIVRRVARECGKALIPDSHIAHVTSILRLKAGDDAALTVSRRNHKEHGARYIDLGNAERQLVKITAQGVSIVPCSEVSTVFIRGRGYGELPQPVLPLPEIPDDPLELESATRAAIRTLAPLLLGVPPKDWIPLIAALVERMCWGTPDPILVAVGPSGSGKTTMAWRWTMVIDPFVGSIPSVENDVRTVTATAQRRHTINMDNAGELGHAMEDKLCTSSLGCQITVRTLYETAKSQDLPLNTAWVITSTIMPIRREDTHNRSLVIHFAPQARGTKRSETVMNAEFKAVHSELFSNLLWLLQLVMRYEESKGPRMSDDRMVGWESTGEYISQALGKPPGAYANMRAKAQKNQALKWLDEETDFAAPFMEKLADLAAGAVPAAGLPPNQVIYQHQPWVGTIGGRITIATTGGAIHVAMHGGVWPRGCTPAEAKAASKSLMVTVRSGRMDCSSSIA